MELSRVAEALVEVGAGHLGIHSVKVLYRHGLKVVTAAIVDGPHLLGEGVRRVAQLRRYALPRNPAAGSRFNDCHERQVPRCCFGPGKVMCS